MKLGCVPTEVVRHINLIDGLATGRLVRRQGWRTTQGLRLYLDIHEAREVARRLWAANEALLRELYAKNAPGGVFFDSRMSSSGRGGGKRASAAAATASALRWREAYRSFFVSTVAVPPNRLRPPSRLGEATFEHPHNIALAAVVSSSADVANAAAPRRTEAGGNGGAPSSPSPPPIDLAAGLRSWLALQSALNSLIDSSAPDARGANAGAAGVRQALEKKEVRSSFFLSCCCFCFARKKKSEGKEEKNSLNFFFSLQNSHEKPLSLSSNPPPQKNQNRACSAST